jgi:hypothetical protein
MAPGALRHSMCSSAWTRHEQRHPMLDLSSRVKRHLPDIDDTDSEATGATWIPRALISTR